MLTYEPGDTLAHRLDARSKLPFQLGFAIAVFGLPVPALPALTGVALAGLALARLSPIRVLRATWFVLVLVGLAPLFATLVVGSPWIALSRAWPTVVAGYRVVLVVLVAGAVVATTPVSGSRAVVQRLVPGRVGRLLGVGVALLAHSFPLVLGDVQRGRRAVRARGGGRRSTVTRIRYVTVVGLRRALDRSDRLALALGVRCLSWNPTPPALGWSRADWVVLAVGVALAVSPIVRVGLG